MDQAPRGRRGRSKAVAAILTLSTGSVALLVWISLRAWSGSKPADVASAMGQLLTGVLVVLSALFQWWVLQRQLEAARFQSVFFQYFAALQNYVTNIESGSMRGQHLFAAWARIVELHGIATLHEDYGTSLNHYTKQILVLLKLLHQSGIDARHKRDYIDLVWAQLSHDELIVLRGYAGLERGALAGELDWADEQRGRWITLGACVTSADAGPHCITPGGRAGITAVKVVARGRQIVVDRMHLRFADGNEAMMDQFPPIEPWQATPALSLDQGPGVVVSVNVWCAPDGFGRRRRSEFLLQGRLPDDDEVSLPRRRANDD